MTARHYAGAEVVLLDRTDNSTEGVYLYPVCKLRLVSLDTNTIRYFIVVEGEWVEVTETEP